MVYWKKNDFHKSESWKHYPVECNKTYEEFCTDIFQEVKKLRGKIWSDAVIKQEMLQWSDCIGHYYKKITTTKESNLPSSKFYQRNVEDIGSLVADMAV